MATNNTVKTFFGGKQERDNDPRVVPDGEYIRLVNGQISRSEGSTVGALTNTSGNISVTDFVDADAVVLGSIRDVGVNKIYYFIHGVEEDAVYEYDENTNETNPILRDDRVPSLLNFNVDNLITGINIIGEGDQRLLLWTDNFNPPRKVNIARAKTRFSGGLIDSNGRRITDEFISVVKSPPLFSPLVEEVRLPDNPLASTISELDPFLEGSDLDLPLEQKREKVEDIVEGIRREENLKEKFPRFAYRWVYEDNEYSAMSPFSAPAFRPSDFLVDTDKGILESMENQIKALDISFNSGPREVVEIELVYKEDGSSVVYVVESYNKEDRGWRDNVDLAPDNFESGERSVRFASQKLYRALPSTQLERVYDVVPLRAQSQEIIDNRIVYGNYTDQYDLIDIRKEFDADGAFIRETRHPIVVGITARRTAAEDLGIGGGDQAEEAERTADGNIRIPGSAGYDNLKSDRDYELGIVYLDDIGRQTPVLTSQNNTVHIPASNAADINRISVDIESKAPEFATGYRFFIKETKGDFYNIFPVSQPLVDTTDINSGFTWIKITREDSEKIKAGDYLNLKVTEDSAPNANGKNLFRVDAVEAKGINFLETGTNRLDPEDEDSPVIIEQSAGFYMRLEDNNFVLSKYNSLAETVENNIRITEASQSNNSSGPPIVFAFTTDPEVDFPATLIEAPYYYPNPNTISDDERPGAGYVVTGGTYDPDTATFNGDDKSGSMRVQLQIIEGATAADREISWQYWIGTTSGIQISTPVIVPFVFDTPIAGPNGVTFQFNSAKIDGSGDWVEADFGNRDRYTFICRNSMNFLWGRHEVLHSERGMDDPNSFDRDDFVGMRANTVIKLPIGEIPQGSQIQIGVEDGRGSFAGTPLAFQFEKNLFQAKRTYPNFEEWIFEERLWDPNATGAFVGSGEIEHGYAGGTLFESIGFWRGLVTKNTVTSQSPGAAGLLSDLLVPFQSAIFNQIEHTSQKTQITTSQDAYGVGDLGMIIHSGTRNTNVGNAFPGVRMTAQFYFTPGSFVTSVGRTRNIPYLFETQPEDSNLDFYYEIGDTFTCLNGIHFGNEMSDNQTITYVDSEGVETTSSMDDNGNPIALTETAIVSKITINLDYTNCFAFFNGVESRSIRDEFLEATLDKGAKVSTVSQRYRERNNFANLIFSQPFNAQDGVNGLNEFSSTQAALEQIIKEIDTSDGSIQKLFSRDTDLVVFQEDKVSKVLVNKDAWSGADGTQNVVSSSNILGQTIAYTGEFGISKNPESFAVYGNRLYFADRNRGAVLRLSTDGLEEISNYGMRDFFRDEFREMYTVNRDGVDVIKQPIIIGLYDDYHDRYVLSTRIPLESPRENRLAQPLLLSKQAFLSRTDACRFPEPDLQFTEVYEFYTESGTAPIFNEGDIIFYDRERTSRFNGDNDWFVYFQRERLGETFGSIDPQALGDAIETDGIFSVDYFQSRALLGTPEPGQAVTVTSTTSGSVYQGRITRLEDGVLTISYDEGTVLDSLDQVIGHSIEVDISYKFVIQINQFGFVLDKLDCLGIVPPNHDAVRVSLRSFMSPIDACGKGIVVRLIYHNGNDPSPDPGDSIFDTPFGEDEFFEGNYFKGRTQKRGWYKMFDGDDLEDYVINIIQGRVVEKVRCAEIDAGRRRILSSEFPLLRRISVNPDDATDITTESDVRLATRICSMLPTEENFHNGTNILPEPGDSMFTDNFTNSPLRAGFYSVEGGFFVELTANGIVIRIEPCTVIICVDDVVNEALINLQNNSENNFIFRGVGNITDELPTLEGTPGIRGADDGTIVLNGAVSDLGSVRSGDVLWYYQIGGEAPTERALVRDGIQIGPGVDGAPLEITNTGGVDAVTISGLASSIPVYHIFAIQVGNIIVTTDVFSPKTARTVLPTITSFVVDPVGGTPRTGVDVTFTVTIDRQEGDDFGIVWLRAVDDTVDGVEIDGGTITDNVGEFIVASYQAGDNGFYYAEVIFDDLTLTTDRLETAISTPIAPLIALTTVFSAGVTEAVITATVTDPDQPAGVAQGFAWTASPGPSDLSTAVAGFDPPFVEEGLLSEDDTPLTTEDDEPLEGFIDE